VRIITYRGRQGSVLTGVVTGEQVLDISAWLSALPLCASAEQHNKAAGMDAPRGGIMRWLQAGESALSALASHVQTTLADPQTRLEPLGGVHLYAPVPRPGKIIGVGRNYADHAAETGVKPFEKPRIIFKVSSSVAAPGAPVSRPAGVTKMDFEAELAVIIGGYGKNIPQSEALGLVGGYTVLNDLSAREYQFDISPPQTTFAKSMDGFAPMGPWLVTTDEIPDPQQLEVSCWLNDTQMQHGHTAHMLFPVSYLISYLSNFMTLEPGDVIGTGTPAGIGAFRKPPIYLKPGDRLRLEVTRVGAMEHMIA
jgi:2-keto-4-pentenoate hydratase/2-oxohepta-3-ene-1,7-dioic acid hydratase in catechol pathway